jgi:SnoaL-like domain
MSDRDEIQELLAGYSLLLEQEGAFESWLDLFTDDAGYRIFGRQLYGRQEIGEMISAAHHGIHLLGLPTITVEGTTGRSTVNFVFFPHEGDQRTMGWYFDRYVRTDGRWRISEHVVEMCTPRRSQFGR